MAVLLVANGKPTLGVGIDAGNWWNRSDHWDVVVPFGAADRNDLAADVEYRFVPRNDGKRCTWQVAESLRVIRRP